MMQIHPPSSISLLSEMFNSNNNNGASNADGENSTDDDRNGKLPKRTPTRSRTEIADHPSFAMRPSSSSRRVRYHPTVQVPQQQEEEEEQQENTPPPHHSSFRRTGRRRSPPRKIAPGLRPTCVESTRPEREERDDDDDDDEQEGVGTAEPTSGPITCFSYRTMEKEYEKDTLRMLERIRRSRSFVRKDPVATRSYRSWNSCHLPDNGSTTPAAAADDDDSSSSSDGGGFYIGDDSLDANGGFGWCDHGSGSEPPSLTLLGSCGDFDDDVISDDEDEDEDDDGEEEIFELDL